MLTTVGPIPLDSSNFSFRFLLSKDWSYKFYGEPYRFFNLLAMLSKLDAVEKSYRT
jgi:hypothetical protein